MHKRRAYHHGELRAALIDNASAILLRDGVEAVTLRAIAARAGVSHAAPAHHFADLKSLLAAVAARGFDNLSAALAKARLKNAANAAERLRAVSNAYVGFALGAPGLFTLMFSPEKLDGADAELRRAARAAYGELELTAALALKRGAVSADMSATEIEYLIWSSAHGYTQLALARLIPKPGAKFCRAAPDVARLLFARARSKPRKV